MIIVQISDLHVGSQFNQEKFDLLVDEVNQLNPDVIVVTGDLTNEGLMKEYEKCKSILSKFDTTKIILLVVTTIIEIQVISFSKNSFQLKQFMS